MKLTESVHCYIDSASGQYIPKRFACETKRECLEGVKAEDLDYLARGHGGVMDEALPLLEGESVRGEHYWDVWQDVLDNAVLVDPESGLRFKLHNGESGDIFLVPEDWEWNDETESFEKPATYPDCYLHVEECRSGETWIVPIGDNDPIDLEANLDKWIAQHFDGEQVRDGETMPKLSGDYYAKIMTDGRPPDSVVCWTSGGFYLKANQPATPRSSQLTRNSICARIAYHEIRTHN